MSGVTDTYHEDPLVLTATFPLLGGANLAVQKLQELEKQGLLDVENTLRSARMPGTRSTSTRRPATAVGRGRASAPL